MFQDGKRSTALASSNVYTDVAAPLHVLNNQMKPRERLYYLDWLRSIAIEHVVLVHTIQVCYGESKLDKKKDA